MFVLNLRSCKAQIGYIFLLVLIISAFYFVALGADQSHLQAVRTELQNATDAAALAGAADLWNNIDQASTDALAWASKNSVDGKPLTAGPGRTINVVVTKPQGNTPGEVAVTASVEVDHLFSRIMHRWSDTVTMTSVAGTTGELWMAAQGQLFPVAVSLNTIPSTKDWTGKPLSAFQVGDTFTLCFASQGTKNAAWTSFVEKSANAAYISSAIDQMLGLAKPQPGFIPSVKVGDTIYLNNGIVGEKSLATPTYENALKGVKYILLPIFAGDPPFNQTQKVLGFMALQVTNVQVKAGKQEVETITGILCTPQVEGSTGPFPTTGDPIDPSVVRFAPGPIQLLH